MSAELIISVTLALLLSLYSKSVIFFEKNLNLRLFEIDISIVFTQHAVEHFSLPYIDYDRYLLNGDILVFLLVLFANFTSTFSSASDCALQRT